MIEYIVHGNKWVFNTIFGGAALVAIFILTCWAMWRPREEEKQVAELKIDGVRSFGTWLVGVVPWAVILVALGTLVFSIVHTLIAAVNPPNW